MNISLQKKQIVSTASIAGRGAIYITLAKLYFMVTGYVIVFILPRILSKSQYGEYGLVTSFVSIINAVIITGTQQTVSKFVSENPSSEAKLRNQALYIQSLLGTSVVLIYVYTAPYIAIKFWHDPSLILPLRISALITFFYSFYAVYMGYLNGKKDFLRQSSLDISYSTFKMLAIILMALLLRNVSGSVAGFALGAFLVLLLAISIASSNQGNENPHINFKQFLLFQIPTLLFVLFNNLLQKVDIVFLKAYSAVDPIQASANAGDYIALMNIANIVHQMVVSITFVIFPLISKASFEKQTDEVKSYIHQTLRVSLIIMALLATVFSSNATALLGFLYPKIYVVGAPALQIVAFGMLGYGLITVLTSIITSSGHPRISLTIGLITLIISIFLNYNLIPKYGVRGAAIGTTISMAIGASIACIYVRYKFSALITFSTFIRIIISALLILPISMLPLAGYLVVAKVALQFIIFFLVLVLTGEIRKTELNLLKGLLKR